METLMIYAEQMKEKLKTEHKTNGKYLLIKWYLED